MRRVLSILMLFWASPVFAQVDSFYGGLTPTQGQCIPNNVALPSSHGAISAISNSAGVTSATVTSTAELHVGEAFFVSGVAVSGYNNAGTAAPYIVATIPDGTHLTWAQTASLGSSSGGSISRAQYFPRFIGALNRWMWCAPNAELFFVNAFYDATDYYSNPDYNDVTASLYNAARYNSPLGANILTGAGNSHYYETQRWKAWGINSVGPYTFSGTFPYVPKNSDYSTSDHTIPQSGKLPYMILPRPATQSTTNTNGYASDSVTEFHGSAKTNSNVAWGASHGPSNMIDPMSPYLGPWLIGCLQDNGAGCADSAGFIGIPKAVTGKWSDLLVGILIDDSDYLGCMKAGSKFLDWRLGVNESYPGSIDNNCAYMVLGLAPIVCGNHQSGNLNITVVYKDCTMYVKAGPNGMVNWFAGTGGTPVNQTISVSASGTGTIETFTGSFDDGSGFPKYIPGELISITGCGSYSTSAGTGVKVVSATTSSFTLSGAITGAQSGCTVFDGPNYVTIGAFNSAWGSQYSQFTTTGTTRTQVTLSTSDHLTYTGTLPTGTNGISPLTTQVVTSAGVPLASVDGGSGGTGGSAGPTGTTTTSGCAAGQADLETFIGSGVSAGTLCDTNGTLSITFSGSQLANEPLKTNGYQTDGWGRLGTGLVDEDGTMPSKGANSPWLPLDPWCDLKTNPNCGASKLANMTATAANVDVPNFITFFSKFYFRTMKESVASVYPGVPYLCDTNVGTWSNPARPGVLTAAGAYCDVFMAMSLPTGVDTLANDQAREDEIVNNAGDVPIMTWQSVVWQNNGSAVSTTGTINSGQKTLTVASVSGWGCGMGIRVTGAGAGGGTLQTHLAASSCISGSVLTLADAAGTSVIGAVARSLGDTVNYFDGFTPNGTSSNQNSSAATAATYWTTYTNRMLTLKSTAFGHGHRIGQIIWRFEDSGQEGTGYGWETPRGNAYDGVQDCYNTGTDIYGFPTGGEIQIAGGPGSCYGDFIDGATTANIQWQLLFGSPTAGSISGSGIIKGLGIIKNP